MKGLVDGYNNEVLVEDIDRPRPSLDGIICWPFVVGRLVPTS